MARRRTIGNRLRDADRSFGRLIERVLLRLGIRPFRGRVLAAWLLAGSLASVLLFVLFFAFAYWLYAHDLKPPDQAIAERSGTSVALDRTEQAELHQYTDPLGGLRHPVPLSEISPYIVAATIATEDPSFFDNPGVNFRGVARAAFENLTPFGPGLFKGSGGSGITQQLARNIYVDPEARVDRRISRKVKETVIALELKRRYEDDQILGWYLNQIYYGNYAYGAEVAAQSYFGKSAKDVTLAEAALLAGLPQAPNDYTPAIPENIERAKGRQLQVLDLMSQHAGDIAGIVQVSREEIEAAKVEPLNYAETKFRIEAPHFVFYVEDQVTKMCHAGLFEPPKDISCDDVVAQGGLRITTTLDLGLNKIGERVLEEQIAANEENYNGHNGALVAIKPETGEVLAYVGSRSFWRSDIAGQVDIASSLRSHGSAMKVFSYLTAFKQGWVPSTYVDDAPLFVDAGGAQKQINNWNAKHLGKITVRRAPRRIREHRCRQNRHGSRDRPDARDRARAGDYGPTTRGLWCDDYSRRLRSEAGGYDLRFQRAGDEWPDAWPSDQRRPARRIPRARPGVRPQDSGCGGERRLSIRGSRGARSGRPRLQLHAHGRPGPGCQ